MSTEAADATDIIPVAQTVLETHYRTASGHQGALPPGFITGLLQMLLQLLAGGSGGLCPTPTPASAIATCQNPTARAQLAVDREVRQMLRQDYGFGAYRQYNGPACVQAVFATGAGATEEQATRLQAVALNN